MLELRSPSPLVARLAAWSIVAISLVLVALTIVLTVVVRWPNSTPGSPDIRFALLLTALILPFAGVGAVVASRVPRNPVGWLLAGIGLSAAVTISSSTVAAYDRLIAPGSVPDAPLAMWLGQWFLEPGIISAVVFVPLLFPSGHLPSRRWRPFAVVAIAAIAASTASTAFGPWPTDQWPGVPNPYQLRGPLLDAVQAAATLSNVTGPPALLLVLGSLVVRFRRSEGVERQQFKWFAYAAAVAVAGQAIANLAPAPASDVLFMAALLALDLIPIAAGFAILRYRLYDIDLVINRTLVYGSLTAVLGLVYAGSVLGLETVLSPLTRTSSLAVAVSTLLVAALFQPVRRRLQQLVDRRFYRRRYSATREIARFAGGLRDEVDVARVQAMLGAAVDRTVQPAFASIWLREGGER